VPAQPVDAIPSAINLFSKGGVYGASAKGEAYRVNKLSFAQPRGKIYFHLRYMLEFRWHREWSQIETSRRDTVQSSERGWVASLQVAPGIVVRNARVAGQAYKARNRE